MAGDGEELEELQAFSFGPEQQAALDALTVREDSENFGWKPKGHAARAKFEISAYIGLNGHGKTLAMVHDTFPALREGRRVYSTVPLLHPVTHEPHPFYVPLTDWGQLLEERGRCEILFDEVQGIANSRTSQGLPVQVQTLLHQLRKKDMRLRWTAPSWSRADLMLREVTRTVTVCRGYFPERVRDADGRPLAWGANRLFRWLTYDAADFTEWTDNKETKLKGLNNTWYWRPRNLAQALYDTRSVALRVGEVLDAGTCAYCGGHKPRRPCSCASQSPHVHVEPTFDGEISPAAGAGRTPVRLLEHAAGAAAAAAGVTPADIAARLDRVGLAPRYVPHNSTHEEGRAR